MIIRQTELPGVFTLDVELSSDERGSFMRTWCAEEYTRHGLEPALSQCSVSVNTARGTLRGMHWQAEPYGEAKTVRCPVGSIYDVIVDVRPESPTYLKWLGVELSAANKRSVYVPRRCAHGFITLQDATEVEYLISTPYTAASSRGIRWNDPAVGIRWPMNPVRVSAKDDAFPLIDRGGPPWKE